MDSQELPDVPTFKEQTSHGAGLAGAAPKNKGGRPRKQIAAGDGGNVASFSVPKRQELKQEEKQDTRKFAVIPIQAITDKNITPSALRILALVASYANRNGFTWVSQETLAERMCITNQAISLHIVALKKAGYLEETAKAYWSGPTARSSTLRIVYDPTLTADDVIARAGSADQTDVSEHSLTKGGREEVSEHSLALGSNISERLVGSTSFESKVVNSRQPTKADLERLRPSLIAEVLARYRTEGLPDPGRDRLEREVAELASIKARSGTLLA